MGAFAFLSIFYTHSTFSEKKFILTVSMMYGLIAPALMGFGIWFMRPHIQCKKSPTDEYHDCLDSEFCGDLSSYIFRFLGDSAPSLSATVGLVCEMRKNLLESYFFGGIMGCLANIVLPIAPNKRKLALVFFGLVHAMANFSIVLFYENRSLLQLSLLILAFSLMILHANCPLIINEAFVGDLARASISVLLMFWGLMGLTFVGWAYINNSDFYRGFVFMGVLHFVNSMHLYFQDEPEVHDILAAKKQSVYELSMQVLKEKQIPFNIFAYVLAWSAFCVTYNQINLVIGTLGGNIYFNLAFFSILEFVATFCGSFLGGKFPAGLGNIIRYLMILETGLSAIFIFVPLEITPSFPPWGVYLLVALMAIVKFISDVVNNTVSLFAPKICSIQYVRLFLTFSRLSSRLILFCVPEISAALKKHGIHPFMVTALFWLLCSILSVGVKPIKEDPIHTHAIQKRRSSSKDLRVKVEEHDDVILKKKK